jgi:hypothetical protein
MVGCNLADSGAYIAVLELYQNHRATLDFRFRFYYTENRREVEMPGHTVRQFLMFALVDLALFLAYILVAISLPFVQLKRRILKRKA